MQMKDQRSERPSVPDVDVRVARRGRRLQARRGWVDHLHSASPRQRRRGPLSRLMGQASISADFRVG
jgi:hypothetical protein